MKTVNIYEAKTHLSRLISELQVNEEPIVLCRNGVPVADLVPHRKAPIEHEPLPELQGACFLGNPTAPLDEEDWPEALR